MKNKHKYGYGFCEVLNALMCSAVNVIEQPDSGGGSSRGRLGPEAIERIQQRQGTAAPGGDGGTGDNDGGAPAPGTAAAGAASGGGGGGDGGAGGAGGGGGAARAPAVTTPSAPAAEPPGLGGQNMQAAIELERSTRTLERTRNELTQATRELAQLRAGSADPMQLLAAHGHKIEDVVQSWLGPDDADPAAGGAAGAGGQQRTPAARQQQQPSENPEVAALKRQVDQLTAVINGAQSNQQRGSRLDNIKQMVSGAGDALGLMSALGLEDGALASIEQIEQQQGGQLGQIELLQRLHDHEKASRKNVETQIGSLTKLPWAQETMLSALAKLPGAEQSFRKALDSAAGARPAPATSTAPATQGQREHTPPAATESGNGSTADASRQQRSPSAQMGHNELRQRARARAAEILTKQRAGLG